MSVRSSRRTPLINGAVVDAHVAIFDGTTGAIKDGGVPAGTGTVTNSGTLTSNALIIGGGTTVVSALGSLGTTTTVLHGNASGAPTYGAVSLTADVSGDLPFSSFVQASAASKIVGRGSASGAGDFQEISLGSGLSMSGTTLSSTGAAAETIIVKPGDESITNNTLQNDDDFVLAIAANETWIIEGHLFVTGLTAADFQWAFNVPSGATGWNTGLRIVATATTTTDNGAWSAIEDLTDTGARQSGVVTGSAVHVQVNAIVINGANSGNIQFRWAQVNTNATGTVVEAGSYMSFKKK